MQLRPILFLILTGSSLLVGLRLRDWIQATSFADVALLEQSAAVPFEPYGGHLWVKGTINGAVADRLILDSGAADIFVSRSQAQTLRLQSVENVSIPGGKSGDIPTVYVPDLMFQIGGLTLRDRRSVVIPSAEMQGLAQFFGRTFDGIMGFELFQQMVVEVNYQTQRLQFYRPDTYQYQGKGQRIPLQIRAERPYVDVTILPYGYPAIQGTFLVDLGSNGALSMAATCGLDQTLIAAAPHTLPRTLTTLHGAQPIHLGRVQKLEIGSLQFDQPLTTFSAGQSSECDRVTGKIGNQILQQFRVIFDYPHQQLILEPRTDLHQTNLYEYDLSGLWLSAAGTDLKTYRVGAVFPNTPAAQAGVRPGDILNQVNGRPAAELTLGQIRQQLTQPGQTVDVGFRRGAQSVKVRLALNPLL